MGWAGAVRGLRRFVPPSTKAARDAVGEAVARMGAARIVDVGAGGRRVTANALTVDLDRATRPDVVASIYALPFGTGSVAAVFCTGTLEHVAHSGVAAHELLRVLRPG